MCGIAGIIGTGKNYSKALDAMLMATKHRGPDHTGSYHDEVAYIGMNRLSIIDTSNLGNQPFISDDGRFILVYNGEIYNYKELREQLRSHGYKFKSNTDSEVLLKTYTHYGKKMLNLIRGMFAFAIWDKNDRKLWGARDHLGIKPFLFSLEKKRFVFCSELKGLLASGLFIQNNLNKSAIQSFITLGHTVAPETMIEGIESLKPGHCFEYFNNRLIVQQYWHPLNTYCQTSHDLSYQEVISEVRKLILNSVNEELVSDVPLGIFLSSGLDSTIVTAAAKYSNISNIETYTVGFENTSFPFDESSIAQQIANHYQTNHKTLYIRDNEIHKDFFDFIHGLDQPSRDGLNTYLVAKHVSQNVKVALSGLGGDELFCGYNGFFKYISKSNYPPFLGKLDELIENSNLRYLLSRDILRKAFRFQAFNNDILYYVFWLQSHIDNYTYPILNKDWLSTNPYRPTAKRVKENYQLSKDGFTNIRLMYLNLFMSNMLLRDSDAVAMKNSLEVRFPLIDKRIVELAFQLPINYLINQNNLGSRNYLDGGLKKIMRDAFKDHLPLAFFNQNKRGFQLPIQKWMNTSLHSILQDTIMNPHEIFDKKTLLKLFDKGHVESKSLKTLWAILILDNWMKNVYTFRNT